MDVDLAAGEGDVVGGVAERQLEPRERRAGEEQSHDVVLVAARESLAADQALQHGVPGWEMPVSLSPTSLRAQAGTGRSDVFGDLRLQVVGAVELTFVA